MNREQNIWEEKSYIEQSKNSENKIESDECDIIKSTKDSNKENHLRDIIIRKRGFIKPLNLIGKRFGMLLVTDFSGKNKKRTCWKCKCDCGNEIIAIGTNLIRNNTTSCGCKRLTSKKYNFTDLTGRKFGELTVIKKSDRMTKWRGTLWECECSCGGKVIVSSNALTSGNNTTCKNKNIHTNNGKLISDLRTGEIPNSHINAIKQNAIKRNIKYSLTSDYLWNIFLSQNRRCVLSGIELFFTKNNNTSKYRKETTASLDRIDSSKGYVKGNVQWVHKDINKMKLNKSDKEFIELCKICYLHNLKNKDVSANQTLLI